jgi:hypothetical protein
MLSLDLHVLSTPPAFVLSQDQTLQQKPFGKIHPASTPKVCAKGINPTNQQNQSARAKNNLALAYKAPC